MAEDKNDTITDKKPKFAQEIIDNIRDDTEAETVLIVTCFGIAAIIILLFLLLR